MAIVDLSHHQNPADINYDTFAKQLEFAIIRTQYGSATIDKYYKTHHEELKKRSIVTHSYAWVRGVSISDMEKEAQDFYDRTKDIAPYFWWLDIEEVSMQDMRSGIKAYTAKLRSLGIQRMGAYIAHNLYTQLNIDIADFDAVWIPRYGDNNGQVSKLPDFSCDLHQYTSKGRLDGYAGDLDLNQILSHKPLSFFTGTSITSDTIQAVTQLKSINEIAGEVISGIWGDGDSRKAALASAGYDYQDVQNQVNEMLGTTGKSIEDTAREVIAGQWGDGDDRKNRLTASGYNYTAVQEKVNELLGISAAQYRTYVVKDKDSLWKIAASQLGNGSRYSEIKSLNELNSDTIYPGQVLKIPE